MPKTAVIIVAGGSGTRMGGSIPKQFLPLAGKPVLVHTVERFVEAIPGAQIIVALPAPEISTWNDISARHGLTGMHEVCQGGETRFESVKNALSLVKKCDLIAVHDGVRPLVSAQLIEKCIAAAQKYGAGIPAITPADSFRETMPNGSSTPVDRSHLRAVQTPQVFSYDILKRAYQTSCDKRFTDDASVVEHAGNGITLCEGDPANIKITTPSDLIVAEALLSRNNG